MKKVLLTFVAFFAMVSMVFAQEIKWANAAAWTAVTDGISYTSGAYTLTAVKAGGSSTPAVNSKTNDLRIYAKGVLTVESTANFKKIVFGLSSKGKQRLADITPNVGNIAIDTQNWTVTWTGDAKSVALTVGEKAVHGTDGAGASGQFGIATITIDANGGGNEGGNEGGNGGGDVTPDTPAKGQVFAESFAAGLGQFTIDNKVMPAPIKAIWSADSYGYMKGSAFIDKTTKVASESWLISPVIDLTKSTANEMSFEHAAKFFGTEFTKLCSVRVKAEGATEWATLTFDSVPDGSSWHFYKNTADLKAYDGKKIQVAFVYTSTTTTVGTWDVKNLQILGDGVTTPVYKTIADLKKNATATSETIKFDFANLLVTGVAERKGSHSVYVTDGVEGMLFYSKEVPACKKGDKISGTLEGGLKVYKGLTEIENADYAAVKVVSSNNTVTPKTVTIADLTNGTGLKDYENMFVTVENLTFAAEAFDKNGNISMVDDSDNQIQLRDNFSVLADFIIQTTVPYNVTAHVSQYNGQAQLYPMSKDDLKMQTNLKDAQSSWTTAEVAILAGEKWEVNNAFKTQSDAAVTYTSSNEAVATVDAAGKITIKGFGAAEIVAETAETATYLASKASFQLFVIEGDGTLAKAYTPADVQYFLGKTTEKVWVVGEIVGVYENNKLIEGNETKVASNIALRVNGISVPVQLSSKTAPRAGLNLVDNPGNLNKKVWVLGSLETYFGFPGVKGLTGFSLDGITGIDEVETENGAQVIYDLAGRRVAKAVKGLYIINGKKVYVK